MSLDTIEQKAKTILSACYKLAQSKNKKETEETKKYIASLADSIEKDAEEEKNKIQK